MDNYRIVNKDELDQWMKAQMQKEHSLTALKSEPPPDAVYSDGTPCTGLINIAWKCIETGEVIDIEYEKSVTGS